MIDIRQSIAKPALPNEMLAFWYLGQEGFLYRYQNFNVLVDPYLSDYVDKNCSNGEVLWQRSYAPPILPQALSFVDVVVITHSHYDHMDPETLSILNQNSEIQFIGSYDVIDCLLKLRFSAQRLFALDDMEGLSFESCRIKAIATAHEVIHYDENNHCKELSYEITFSNGIGIFHGGDMSYYEGFTEKLSSDIQVAMLPINGRSWRRTKQNIIGNMTFDEAADFANDINCDLVIPMHHDLYPINQADSADFAGYMNRNYQGAKYHIMQVGERFIYMRDDE